MDLKAVQGLLMIMMHPSNKICIKIVWAVPLLLSWYWEKVIMNECIKYYQNNQQVLSVRCRGVVGVTESRSLVEPGWSRS